MINPVRQFVFSLLAATVLLCLTSALAWAVEDPDWPCIQRLVPEISAVTIWDGPPIEDALRTWPEKPAIRDLVAKLATRQMNAEQAEQNITAFVKTLQNEEKNPALTMVFAG
ncbi:MAG TPA: hypothetical protein EYM58_01470, partial [Rhodospirillales bacterium]|nr:hypothetical protein [Rhodospirillales bacterium]